MDAAASMIEKAIVANPTYAEAYNNLGFFFNPSFLVLVLNFWHISRNLMLPMLNISHENPCIEMKNGCYHRANT